MKSGQIDFAVIFFRFINIQNKHGKRVYMFFCLVFVSLIYSDLQNVNYVLYVPHLPEPMSN